MARRHPELVAGLVLVSSIGGEGSVTLGDSILAAPLIGRLASAATLAGFGQVMPRAARFIPSAVLRANALHRPETLPLKEFETFVAEQRLLVEDHDELTERLGEIRCPSIVILGELDLVVLPAASRDLAARLGAELVALEEAGHLLIRDAPEVIADAIVRLARSAETLG